ncbi:MAG: ATP-binding protein [Flavobacteriaceae bacterium]|nr:ATP-binding protein [Flavobacteriaceae bacterium]
MNTSRSFASDRGEAHYFHGRQEEIGFVQDALKSSQDDRKSHSILIQGAPGVGKSALLNELRERMKHRCCVVKLELRMLSNMYQLESAVLGKKKYRKESQKVQGNLKLVAGKVNYERSEPTVSSIFKKIQKPILLTLDEAQMMRVGHVKGDRETEKKAHLFDELHNLQLKQGLVFLIAGLSHTRKVFKDFEISRFSDDCVINLSRLDQKAEEDILRDYLVRGAGVKPNHPNLNDWVHQMSKETYQWAHHISCYGQVAAQKIKKNRGVLSNELFSDILKESRRKKITYYHGRFAELEARERASIYHAFFENEHQESILDKSKVELDFKNNPIVKHPKQMFEELVSRGVLQIRLDGFYQIPIPSLRTWMLQEYQNYLIIMNQKPSVKIQQMFDSLKFNQANDRPPSIKN